MGKPIQSKPDHTLKDIFDLYFTDYLNDPKRKFRLSDYHLKTVHTIRACQTARLGLFQFGCDSCGDSHVLPRSCKHRFCGRCGSSDTMSWVATSTKRLPDIKHHHIVLTLPKCLRYFCKRNKSLVYNLMFQCGQQVIKDHFSKHHNLLPGIISVLHTNGSDLKFHPHIHSIVSAGGLSKSGEIEELSSDYLCPQRVLANAFKKLFISRLLAKLTDQKFTSRLLNKMGKSYHQLTYRKGRDRLIKKLKRSEVQQWIAHIDKPLDGVEKIVAYVGRYTKKSCISERRILSISGGKVKISYKDYKNSKRGDKPIDGYLTLSSTEFLDRLFEHLPEKGFNVVRYYGLYSSYYIDDVPLDMRIKELQIPEYDYSTLEDFDDAVRLFHKYRKIILEKTGKDPLYCYHCMKVMKLVEIHYEKDGQLKIVDLYNSD